MNHSENDVLISAYLDGELTAEERARVEQLLATSAEARQLLYELRALRAGLQDLPQHRLEIDFAQRVLQKTEGEIAQQQLKIDGAASSVSSIPHSPLDIPHSVPLTSHPSPLARRRWPINRRGMVWSLVAVAAAVLIMVANRPPEQNRRAEESVDKQLLVRAPASPVQQLAHSKNLETTPTGSASSYAAQSQVNQIADDRKLDDVRGATGSLSSSGNRAGVAGKSVDESVAETPAATSASGTPLADTNHDSYGITAGPLSKPPLPAPQLSRMPDGILLVQVEMSPEAARRGEFDQLLAKNQIVLDVEKHPLNFALDTSKLSEQAKTTQSDGHPVQRERELDAVTDSSSGLNAPGANAATAAKKIDQLGSSKFSSLQPVDVVFVEATPEQIQQTLSDLRHDPQLFSSVAVTTAPSDSAMRDTSRQWYSYRDSLGQTEKDSVQGAAPQNSPMGMAVEQKTTGRLLSRAVRVVLPPQAGQPSFDVPKLAEDKFSSGEKKPADAESTDGGIGGSAVNNSGGLGGGGFGGVGGGGFGGSGGGGEGQRGGQSAGANKLSVSNVLSAPINIPKLAPAAGMSDAVAPSAGLPAPPSTAAAASAPPASSSLIVAPPSPTPQRALFVFRIANAPAQQNTSPSATPANPPAGK